MITILFISDDPRVADLIARFQPQLRGRMRLSHDFDQGLKEVFDNRPSAVFIQGDITGISGETVARHIKTLLRGEAPRIVLMHSAPLAAQGAKKWFDYSVDFSVSQDEIDEQFKLRLMEIAPGHWQKDDVEQPGSPEDVAVVNGEDASIPGLTHSAESEPFEWESAGNFEPPAEELLYSTANPFPAVEGDDAPLDDVQSVLVGRGIEAGASDVPSHCTLPSEVMATIIEESVTTQSALLEPHPSSPSPVISSPIVPPRVEKPIPAFSPPPVPPYREPVVPAEQPVAPLSSFSADAPLGGSVRDAVPPRTTERGGAAGRRLSLWAAAIVLLLIGGVVGGILLLKGEDGNGNPASKPAVSPAKPHRESSAPAPVGKAAPAAGLPSFIPASGKDRGFGKTHPGWERYRGHGVEYRIFRENGRLKALQVLALNGKAIPESHIATIVKKLTGSETRTVLSQSKKGAYRREVLRVAGNGELVLYRKGSGIRGGVITFD